MKWKVEAPLFSLLSEADFTTDDADGDDMESVEAPSFSPLSEAIEEEFMGELVNSLAIEIDVCTFSLNSLHTFTLEISKAATFQSENVTSPVHSPKHVDNWHGFKFVGNNIDKNV